MGSKVVAGIEAAHKERERRFELMREMWATIWESWKDIRPNEFEDARQLLIELWDDAGTDKYPYGFCPSCDDLVEMDLQVNAQGIAAVCSTCGSLID